VLLDSELLKLRGSFCAWQKISSQITSFAIGFTEVSLLNGFLSKDKKGTGMYDVVFPLCALLCMGNHLYFCEYETNRKDLFLPNKRQAWSS